MTGHKDSFQVQRLEVVNTGRRRRWSLDEKLRIVAESFQGHRQVSATAKRHDISPSLLYSWRKAFREDRHRDEVVSFAPAMIVPDAELSSDKAVGDGRMEIVTTTGRRIIVGADVDARALARVVAVLETR
jgi:transposase